MSCEKKIGLTAGQTYIPSLNCWLNLYLFSLSAG